MGERAGGTAKAPAQERGVTGEVSGGAGAAPPDLGGVGKDGGGLVEVGRRYPAKQRVERLEVTVDGSDEHVVGTRALADGRLQSSGEVRLVGVVGQRLAQLSQVGVAEGPGRSHHGGVAGPDRGRDLLGRHRGRPGPDLHEVLGHPPFGSAGDPI